MRDRWLGSLTVLLFVPAVMGFRACEGDVDLGGDRDGGARDAGPAYDPCGALSCGDACRECPPGDPDCFETEVLKFCQADGRCAATTPMCDPPGCAGPNPSEQCRSADSCIPSACGCEASTGNWVCTADCGGGRDCSPEPAACRVGGCSSQLCVEEGDDGASTCEWREEYACYRTATCARQADGACGWTDTAELRACLAGGGGPGPDGCRVGGCSGQLCLEEGEDGVSTCEWREEYACYRAASCARQADGACGWTDTAELRACLGG